MDLEAFALTLEESNASVRKEEKEIAEKEKGRTARALKASGVSIEMITQCMGLSVHEIDLL